MIDLNLLIEPFSSYAFMRRALAAAFALSVGGAPLGVFMLLRRMTLVGDALTHAILPGAALGFLVDLIASGGPAYGGKFWPIAAVGVIISGAMALSARRGR